MKITKTDGPPKEILTFDNLAVENELNLLKLENQKNTKPKIPSFQEWVKDGKKIPEGLIFTGGSPWFNERTGKNRSPEEVYKIIFRKDP